MARFNRLEAKYLVDRALAPAVTAAIRPYVGFDAHAHGADGTYVLQSLYLDSPTRWAYYEKLAGITPRTKLRFRVYDPQDYPDGLVFVEIKHKEGDFIRKQRTTITRAEYAGCFAGPIFRPPRMDDPVLRAYTRLARLRGMRPSVLVRYHRQAFCGIDDQTIRITFDDRVEALRSDNVFCLDSSPFSALPVGHAVLEIKISGRMPAWLYRLIVKYDLDRRAISKYALCVRASAKTSFRLADEIRIPQELD